MTILNLSTYPPRKCGIASFSSDLRNSLAELGEEIGVLALSDPDQHCDYPAEVICEIRQQEKSDYIEAAELVNSSEIFTVVIIQHEYGIFGGKDGSYVLDFASHLKKPYILVTHTVLSNPSLRQKAVLETLIKKSAAVISMTKRSGKLLIKVYSAAPQKTYVIRHGVPVFVKKSRKLLKDLYGLSGRKIVSTFGLIGPGKGLEFGIRALAKIIDKHPDVLYIIAGGTHPVLLKQEGEKYRQMLLDLVFSLKMENHGKFVNRFLSLEELGDLLYMTDVYLSPYPNRDQAVSGTLSYAIGCGRAIVATPYEYACEMLAKQRGLIAINATPEAIAEPLDRILSDYKLQLNLEKRAEKLGKTIIWPAVAKQYLNVINKISPQKAKSGGM